MRAPSTKFGPWEIRYRQKPYDNRYLQIYYKKRLISEFDCPLDLNYDENFLPYGFLEIKNSTNANIAQWERFWERLNKYEAGRD